MSLRDERGVPGCVNFGRKRGNVVVVGNWGGGVSHGMGMVMWLMRLTVKGIVEAG